MRIVVLQQTLIGDVIVATPLLRQIRVAAPDAHIATVLGPLNRSVAPLLGNLVDEVIDFAKSPSSLARIWWRSKRPRFDWLIDLAEAPLKSARTLVRLIGARHSAGFDSARDSRHDVKMPYLRPARVHIVERYLSMLKPLGLPAPADPHIELSLPAEALEWARQKWARVERPRALVNISGTGPTKEWGVDRYIAFLLAAKSSCPQINFALCGHARDEQAMASIAKAVNVSSLPSTPRFEEFAALVHDADYVVTPDTSVVHLAAAWQRPCLGLYAQRPEDDYWTPYRSPNVSLISPTERIADISLNEVIAGFNRLVAQAGSLSAAR